MSRSRARTGDYRNDAGAAELIRFIATTQQGDGFRKRSIPSFGLPSASTSPASGRGNARSRQARFKRPISAMRPHSGSSRLPGWFRADGSISRRGFARSVVIPGLAGKCAHARSRDAAWPVNITRVGRDTRIGVRCELPRGYMALASHSGSCEHGCGDQCSRQKFKLSDSGSPSIEKPTAFGFSIEMEQRSTG